MHILHYASGITHELEHGKCSTYMMEKIKATAAGSDASLDPCLINILRGVGGGWSPMVTGLMIISQMPGDWMVLKFLWNWPQDYMVHFRLQEEPSFTMVSKHHHQSYKNLSTLYKTASWGFHHHSQTKHMPFPQKVGHIPLYCSVFMVHDTWREVMLDILQNMSFSCPILFSAFENSIAFSWLSQTAILDLSSQLRVPQITHLMCDWVATSISEMIKRTIQTWTLLKRFRRNTSDTQSLFTICSPRRQKQLSRYSNYLL